MATDAPQLDRFLSRVHRRATVWRVVESVGVGVGASAIVAGLLAVGAMLMARDAGAPVIAVMATGAVAGLARGLATLPSRLQSACEADRQLELHDLLGSALALGGSDQPWARTVVAQADERARSLRVGDVLLQRLGGRTWGGIGIATAMAGILAAMGGQPNDAVATGVGSDRAARSSFTGAAPAESRIQSEAVARRTAAQREATSKDGSTLPDAAATRSSTASRSGAAVGASATPAGGQAAAQFNERATPLGDGSVADRFTPANPTDGTLASGDGSPTTAVDGADRAIGRVTGDDRPASDPTIARGQPSTPAGAPRDPATLEAVPDRYRDVVRAYFNAATPSR